MTSSVYVRTKGYTETLTTKLTDCLDAIKRWMQLNFLKLNCNKTELVLIGSKGAQRKMSTF